MDLTTISVGDTVVTKNTHACGENKWTVIRTGADIKLRCVKCGRVVMLSSEKAKKAIKSRVE